MKDQQPSMAIPILLSIWLIGVLAGFNSAEDPNWPRFWRIVAWPVYITWVEVGDYFDEHASNAEDVGPE